MAKYTKRRTHTRKHKCTKRHCKICKKNKTMRRRRHRMRGG